MNVSVQGGSSHSHTRVTGSAESAFAVATVIGTKGRSRWKTFVGRAEVKMERRAASERMTVD